MGTLAGHVSIGLRAAALLSISIVVLAGGCNHPRQTQEAATTASNEVSEVSSALVGKPITIRGKFSLMGDVGPFISLDHQQEVYLVSSRSFTWAKPYSEMDGKLVTATGILRF